MLTELNCAFILIFLLLRNSRQFFAIRVNDGKRGREVERESEVERERNVSSWIIKCKVINTCEINNTFLSFTQFLRAKII